MMELEKKIGYAFRDAALLARALTTPACRMDHPEVADNQRLEFLGDAVLGFLSADAVFHAHPDDQEGALTMRRTHLVSTHALAVAAESLNLRDVIRRNAGAEALPPNAKPLTDALEAVMGAVWLDGGLEAARNVFKRLDLPFDAPLDARADNPKGNLQIRAQAMRPVRHPVYEVVHLAGVAHAPIVTVRVRVEGLGSAEATAGSKTAAEVAAAAALLAQLKAEEGQ